MKGMQLKELLMSEIREQDLEMLNELLERVEQNTNIHKESNRTFFQILKEDFQGKLSPVVYHFLEDNEQTIKSFTSAESLKQWLIQSLFEHRSNKLDILTERIAKTSQEVKDVVSNYYKQILWVLGICALIGIGSRVVGSLIKSSEMGRMHTPENIKKEHESYFDKGYVLMTGGDTEVYNMYADFLQDNGGGVVFGNESQKMILQYFDQYDTYNVILEDYFVKENLTSGSGVSKNVYKYRMGHKDSSLDGSQDDYGKITLEVNNKIIDLTEDEYRIVFPELMSYIELVRETYLQGDDIDTANLFETFPLFKKVKQKEQQNTNLQLIEGETK